MKQIRMERIMRLNWEAGEHWFDKKMMRFFSSAVEEFATVKEGKAYFVSSEKTTPTLRLYSVRVCDLETGIVGTVGEFQEYETQEQAKETIEKIVIGVDDD